MEKIETIYEIIAEVAVQTFNASGKNLPLELGIFVYSLSQDSGLDEVEITRKINNAVTRLRNASDRVDDL
jgi:hypothetical protein